MNRVSTWATLFALILIPTQSLAGEVMTKEETNVLSAVQTMTAAFQKGDIDAVMSSYEPEATVVFHPEAPVSDAAQIREMFTGMSTINPIFVYKGHDVLINGDIAIHLAPWSMKGRTPDGKDVAQSGLSVSVLRKQEDGSWKMVIDNPHGAALMTPNQ